MPVPSDQAVLRTRSLRFLLLATGTVCAFAALFPLTVRLLQPLAVTPWEAQIAMEGIRFAAGLPLYEQGHATHLYGPFLSMALGTIFKLTGLNLVAGRAIFSVAGIGVAWLLASLVCSVKSRWCILIAALFFLALGWRTNFVFYSTQPDCVAALLAVLGLIVWIQRDTFAERSFALALLLGAMLFKQTSAAFALIPIAHLLLWERPLQARKAFPAMIPPAFLVLALITIALMWPQVFFGMVTVPAQLKVHYDQFPSMLLYLLGTFPLLFIGYLALVRIDRPLSARERWIISANVVLVPISVWTAVKSGGGLNSLLFAYLAIGAFVIAALERFFRDEKIFGRRRIFGLIGIVAALLCSLFVQYQNSLSILSLQLGDNKYDRAVAIARGLGRGVVSPQDATIAYRANGYVGRSLFLELDRYSVSGGWPSVLPDSMKQELAAARYVIEVQCYVPAPVFHEALRAQGFELTRVPALEDSAYTLWARKD